jgi:hypothetical protein
MRAHRERTKKLIAAFHFQFANRAAWKCGDCRRSGLETVRRCGWLADGPGPPRVIWARKNVATDTCPVSYITAESIALVQEFQAWKLIGCADVYSLPARTVDGFWILENELRVEIENERQ